MNRLKIGFLVMAIGFLIMVGCECSVVEEIYTLKQGVVGLVVGTAIAYIGAKLVEGVRIEWE